MLAHLVETERNNALSTLQLPSDRVDCVEAILEVLRGLVTTTGRPVRTRQEADVRAEVTLAFNFLTSAALRAISGESFNVPGQIRTAIEAIGYAAHIASSQEVHGAWYGRNREFAEEAKAAVREGREPDTGLLIARDSRGRKKAREAFKQSAWKASLIELLEGVESGSSAARLLLDKYEETIELGAHPNVLSTVINSEVTVDPASGATVRAHLLVTDDRDRIVSDLNIVSAVGWAIARAAAVLVLDESFRADTERLLANHYLNCLPPLQSG